MRIYMDGDSTVGRVLPFLYEPGHMVSLVGGGGKSTLMYFFAQVCARMGRRILVSTTTRIYTPMAAYYAANREQAERLWATGTFAVIGTPLPGTVKLGPAPPNLLAELAVRADTVFLEADGAKGFPCKMPGKREPVLHPESDMVLAVFGLSALGRPLGQVCFRKEEAMQVLSAGEDHVLTPEDGARMITSPLGGRKHLADRKFGVILNQCDDGLRYTAGREMAQQMEGTEVLMTAFSPEEQEQIGKLAKGVWK